MRMSSLLSQTLREPPSDAEITSHQLLVRAGYIRQLAAGIFTSMPLAKRSLTKIENIMRDEMNKIDGQEMSMPVVQPSPRVPIGLATRRRGAPLGGLSGSA